MLAAVRMRTALPLLLAAALLPSCAAAPPLAAPPQPPPPVAPAPALDARAAAVDRLFTAVRPDGPGCALAVAQDGAVVLARGYGLADVEHGVPIQAGTAFHVASLAKQVTALAVELLAAEGRLSLDDDVRRFVPEVPTFAQGRITLRHLRDHTSGLRDYLSLLRLEGFRHDDVITEDDVLSVVRAQRELNFAPGAEHQYSNTGYELLGLVVQRASGQPLADFAAARIFRPLGLTGTQIRVDHNALLPGRARGHEPARGGYRLGDPPFDHAGSTNLASTATDLARFADALAAGRAGGPRVAQAMLTPGRLADGTVLTYAGGLQVGAHRGLAIVEHGGADAGFRAHLARFPGERLTVACLCNAADLSARDLALGVAELFLEGRLAPAPTAPPPDPARAGAYYSEQRDELLRVDLQGGRLRLNGRPALALSADRYALGNGVFAFRGPASLDLAVEGGHPATFTRVERPAPADLAPLAGTYESPELSARYAVTTRDGVLFARPPRLAERRLTAFARDRFHDDDGRVYTFVREAGRVAGLTLSASRVRRLRFTRL
jgi:CubicO group peptidase (beta-lactamase class C family)